MRAIAGWNERSKRARKQPIHHTTHASFLLPYVLARLGLLLGTCRGSKSIRCDVYR